MPRSSLSAPPDETRSELFKSAFNNLKKTQKDVDQVVDWINGQYYWADVLAELRNVLIRVETHSCYVGDRSRLRDWGYGCGACDACKLWQNGWNSFTR